MEKTDAPRLLRSRESVNWLNRLRANRTLGAGVPLATGSNIPCLVTGVRRAHPGVPERHGGTSTITCCCCHPPDQAAQGPAQPGLERSRPSTASLGSPFQCLTALTALPNIRSQSLSFSSKTLPFPIALCPSGHGKAAVRPPRSLLLPRLDSPGSASLAAEHSCSRPAHIPTASSGPAPQAHPAAAAAGHSSTGTSCCCCCCWAQLHRHILLLLLLGTAELRTWGLRRWARTELHLPLPSA
ncbi:unnamed protein product [Coccothraustes coccothraustes]